MALAQTVAEQIIGEVSRSPGCLFEELVLACPELTWNQIFQEVDHLSRTGQLRLSRKGLGVYMLSVPSQ
jgi:hypothetical protein